MQHTALHIEAHAGVPSDIRTTRASVHKLIAERSWRGGRGRRRRRRGWWRWWRGGGRRRGRRVVPCGSVQRHTADCVSGFTRFADVARTHSGVEGEARGCYRVESRNCSLQAVLLVETRGATVKGMTEMVGAERVGSDKVRSNRGGRERWQ